MEVELYQNIFCIGMFNGIVAQLLYDAVQDHFCTFFQRQWQANMLVFYFYGIALVDTVAEIQYGFI